jgi:hypothetical protein
VPFAAGVDAAMPRAFARAASALPHAARRADRPVARRVGDLPGERLRHVAGRATSIQEAYDILVNLTILIYFVPYSVSVRRAGPAAARLAEGDRVDGIRRDRDFDGAHLRAATGSNALTYEVNVIVQAAIMSALGYGLYVWSARRARQESLSAPR